MSRVLLAVLLLGLAWPGSGAAHNIIAEVYVEGTLIEGQVGFSNGSPAPGAGVTVRGPDGDSLGQVQTDPEGVFQFRATRRVAHQFDVDAGAGHVITLRVAAEDLPEHLDQGPPAPAGATDLGGPRPPHPATGAVTPVAVTSMDGGGFPPPSPDESRSATFKVTPGESTTPVVAPEDPMPPEAEMAGETASAPPPVAAAPAPVGTALDEQCLSELVEKAVARQVKPLRQRLQALETAVRFQDVLGGLGYILGLTGLGLWLTVRRKGGGDAP
ncbi:MAG: carboxypeptidase regulatory-like domain-containing protein [Magnetococcales bacterium]|nr:carboxypeptidase regulatory-like domain-containing protein [Magnetococcales bacterium]